LKKWEDLLKANPEAAICEAETRKLLSDHNVDVQPYEDLSHGGPDFICTKDGKTFYVEVTCLTINAVTKTTRLSDTPKRAGCYALLTSRIKNEIRSKTPQCANFSAPCVLAITTLHFTAGRLCLAKPRVEELLTATYKITVDFKNGGAASPPYLTTDLKNSVFIRPDNDSPDWIEHASAPISALLLCGFGSVPPNVLGCLHPSPNHPFEGELLPNIKFARLADGYQNEALKVEWI